MPVPIKQHASLMAVLAMLLCIVPLGHIHGASAAPSASPTAVEYVEATGHTIGPLVADYYAAHDGVAVLGLPLTELFVDATSGRPIQYFERARIEIDPDKPATTRVSRTPLGSELTKSETKASFTHSLRFPPPRTLLIEASGHSLGGVFRDFWQANGAEATFGLPISEPFTQVRAGNAHQVQYFEYARFEIDMAKPAMLENVQLGLLGREYLDQQELDPALTAPAPPLTKLAQSTTYANLNSAGGANIALAARNLDATVVAPHEVISFLDDVGSLTYAAGYRNAGAIVGGQLTDALAGGICQVSTALYRAAFTAGLPIEERYSHSLQLGFFADAPGFEAAVYSPGQDLRVRNDTDYPMLLTAAIDGDAVTISIWGHADGRSVTVGSPIVRQTVAPPEPVWRFDPSLAENTVELRSPAQAGLVVTLGRQIVAADGKTLRSETIGTRYAPMAEIIAYGSGVTPGEFPDPNATDVLTATAELTPTAELTATAELTPTTENSVVTAEPTPEPKPTAASLKMTGDEPTVTPIVQPSPQPTVEPPAEIPAPAEPAEPPVEPPAEVPAPPAEPTAPPVEAPPEAIPPPPAEPSAEPGDAPGWNAAP